MSIDTKFEGDDLRKKDPKFKKPLYNEYLNAVEKLSDFVKNKFKRDIIHLAVRWIFDKGIDTALWGARHPKQLDPINEVWDWKLNSSDLIEIQEIVTKTISREVGPEFMAPYERTHNN
jgi:aryl-alcohol dehydrogenase-like predicted oxidoreductase